ncbi:MAG: serine/threonine protein phosphatase [Clostridia bacterium]|nr:serine/threonine protein phosphatase [Clostridia bacterium]
MIYVLSDIHGNMKRFNSVMEQINLQPDDTLYILGDVIDRYPDGIKILRKLMNMDNIKMLLGNHEYMMLKALDTDGEDTKHSLRVWYNNGGYVTHKYIKHIRKDIRREVFDFLKSLPVNIKIEVNGGKYILVHGSPIENFKRFGRGYVDERDFAVWNRWYPGDYIPDDCTLVFGHTPTINLQNDNPLRLWFGTKAIGIDCGCGFPDNETEFPCKGRLACLRLDDMKVFYSSL